MHFATNKSLMSSKFLGLLSFLCRLPCCTFKVKENPKCPSLFFKKWIFVCWVSGTLPTANCHVPVYAYFYCVCFFFLPLFWNNTFGSLYLSFFYFKCTELQICVPNECVLNSNFLMYCYDNWTTMVILGKCLVVACFNIPKCSVHLLQPVWSFQPPCDGHQPQKFLQLVKFVINDSWPLANFKTEVVPALYFHFLSFPDNDCVIFPGIL